MLSPVPVYWSIEASSPLVASAYPKEGVPPYPGTFPKDSFDLAGFAVGVVDEDKEWFYNFRWLKGKTIYFWSSSALRRWSRDPDTYFKEAFDKGHLPQFKS